MVIDECEGYGTVPTSARSIPAVVLFVPTVHAGVVVDQLVSDWRALGVWHLVELAAALTATLEVFNDHCHGWSKGDS